MKIIHHLFNALINSLNGLKQTWTTEYAFRIEVFGCLFIIPFTLWWNTIFINKAFVILSLFIMFIAELLNTAIEKANDAFKKTNDPLIKYSKDAASAAVFLSLCLVGISLLNLIFFS
jgi:diacylglycerol kinase (ATP)